MTQRLTHVLVHKAMLAIEDGIVFSNEVIGKTCKRKENVYETGISKSMIKLKKSQSKNNMQQNTVELVILNWQQKTEWFD